MVDYNSSKTDVGSQYKILTEKVTLGSFISIDPDRSSNVITYDLNQDEDLLSTTTDIVMEFPSQIGNINVTKKLEGDRILFVLRNVHSSNPITIQEFNVLVTKAVKK